MSSYRDIKECILKMITYYRLNIKQHEKTKIVKKLCNYADLLLFNIVSFVCLIVLKSGHKRVSEDTLLSLKKYLDSRCCIDKKISIDTNTKCSSPKMNGGNSLPAVYFAGNEQSMYKQENIGGDVALIDFGNGHVRNALGGMSGGNSSCNGMLGGFMLGGCDSVTNCKNMNKLINKKICAVFKFYGIICNKNVKEILVKYFFVFINQLFVLITKKTKGNLTLTKLNQILQKTNIMKK